MREFVAEIGGLQLRIQAEESLFSPDGLDVGTRCMLEVAELSAPLLDLGCGSGIVGIYAAKKLGEAGIYLCDIAEQAVDCAKRNAAANGVGGVQCLCSDGLDALPPERFDRALEVFYWIRSLTTLQKKPGTSELLDWLHALALTEAEPDRLPYLGTLLKLEGDWAKVQQYWKGRQNVH